MTSQTTAGFSYVTDSYSKATKPDVYVMMKSEDSMGDVIKQYWAKTLVNTRIKNTV